MSGELVAAGMVVVGLQLSLQAPVNGELARRTGSLGAAFISFLVGLATLGFVIVVSGQLSRLSGLGSVATYELAGGLCGAGYVAAATFAVGRIGAGSIAAATVAGQLSSGVVVDQIGAFGLEQDPAGPLRLLAIPVLVTGALMVAGERQEGEPSLIGKVRPLPLVLVFLAALAVGVQHPLNSSLSEAVGELGAAGLNFTTGTVALAIALLLTAGTGKLRLAGGAPPWAFTGGLIGAVVVLSSLASVGVIGASVLAATTIAGTLAGSVLIDRFGVAGVRVRPLDRLRAGGLLLLLAGTVAVL